MLNQYADTQLSLFILLYVTWQLYEEFGYDKNQTCWECKRWGAIHLQDKIAWRRRVLISENGNDTFILRSI